MGQTIRRKMDQTIKHRWADLISAPDVAKSHTTATWKTGGQPIKAQETWDKKNTPNTDFWFLPMLKMLVLWCVKPNITLWYKPFFLLVLLSYSDHVEYDWILILSSSPCSSNYYIFIFSLKIICFFTIYFVNFTDNWSQSQVKTLLPLLRRCQTIKTSLFIFIHNSFC